jgi:hypothetical protein
VKAAGGRKESKNAHKNCGSTEIIPLQLCIKTGFTNIEYSIGAKWLEPLKEVTPMELTGMICALHPAENNAEQAPSNVCFRV